MAEQEQPMDTSIPTPQSEQQNSPIPLPTPKLELQRFQLVWGQINEEAAPLEEITRYLAAQNIKLENKLVITRDNAGKLTSKLNFAYDPASVTATTAQGVILGLQELGQGNGLAIHEQAEQKKKRQESISGKQEDYDIIRNRYNLKREIEAGRDWPQTSEQLEIYFSKGTARKTSKSPEIAAPEANEVKAALTSQATTPAEVKQVGTKETAAKEASIANSADTKIPQSGIEVTASTKIAPTDPTPSPAAIGELRINWKQQGSEVAPLLEMRAYLDQLKEGGVAVGAMKFERGPDGKLNGSFGVSYDPDSNRIGQLEGTLQGLKKIGNGLEVVEQPAQAQARRELIGYDADYEPTRSKQVQQAFGVRQWDSLSAQLSQAPKSALSGPEQAQQAAGVARVQQVAKQQGKVSEQVTQEGKSLLEVDTTGNPVSAFLKNFYEHLNGAPKTRQNVEADFEATRQDLQNRLTRQAGNATAIQTEQTSTQTKQQLPVNEASGGAIQQPSPTSQAPNTVTEGKPTLTPAAKFTKADLPQKVLLSLGLTSAELTSSGQLQKLLNGEKTDLLTLKASGPSGQEPVRFEAKMLLHREADGSATLKMDLPKKQLIIPNEIGGQAFTPEQRQRLETEGTAGLVRGLKDTKGQTYNGYVGVDKEMNRVVILPESKVNFKETIAGVTLSPEQRHDLHEGKAVHLAQMSRTDGGKPFDGTVQIHAAKAGVEVKPEPYELAQKQAPAATQKRDLDSEKKQVPVVKLTEKSLPKPRVRGPRH